jgi:hypothetical protein
VAFFVTEQSQPTSSLHKISSTAMASQICILFFVCLAIVVVKGQTDCLNKCTATMYETDISFDPISMLNMEPLQLQDGTTVGCFPTNDSARLEKACKPYRAARQCLDQCPFSEEKTNLYSRFAALQYMCNDANDDWKGYTPCLNDHCSEIQTKCEPKCGSFNQVLKVAMRLLDEANERRTAQNPTAINIKKVYKVISDSCSRIYCINDCAHDMTFNYCGNGAWAFANNLQWETFSSIFYQLRDWGVNIDWPIECKTLVARLSRY